MTNVTILVGEGFVSARRLPCENKSDQWLILVGLEFVSKCMKVVMT